MSNASALLKDLGSADWWVRRRAIKGLLANGEEAYLPFVEAAIRNQEDATLRNAAMELYKAMGGNALASLGRILADGSDEEARLFAANLMGDIKDKNAVPALVIALKDPDVNVRVASAEALGKIGDSSAVGPLSELFADEPWVALAAVKSLGDIGGEEALRVLYSCVEKEELRGMAFNAIEKAGDNQAIRRLTPYIEKDGMKEIALRAVVGIAEREGTKPMPAYFLGLVPELVELTKSPSPDIGRAAFIALSWSEDPRAIPHLVDGISSEERQEYSINALIAIGKRAVPAIIDALKDTGRPERRLLAKLLSMLGEHMALSRFSRDEDPEVRVEAALSLGKIPSAHTVEHLSIMLSDPDEEVRLAARRAVDDLSRII